MQLKGYVPAGWAFSCWYRHVVCGPQRLCGGLLACCSASIVSRITTIPNSDYLYSAKYFIVDRMYLFVRRDSKPILETAA